MTSHTVNENWLGQAKGIFPTAYVQVLSHEQLRELLSQEKAPLLHAMAAYDFQSQSEKELSFKKGDVIVIIKKVMLNGLRATYLGPVYSPPTSQ